MYLEAGMIGPKACVVSTASTEAVANYKQWQQ